MVVDIGEEDGNSRRVYACGLYICSFGRVGFDVSIVFVCCGNMNYLHCYEPGCLHFIASEVIVATYIFKSGHTNGQCMY